MFIEKPSIIRKWFADKGYTGTFYDVQFAYFQTLSNLTKGTLYDHVYDRMIQLGFSGTLDDMLDSFFTQKMSQGDPKIAERLFWKDSSLEFSLVTPTSEALLTEDGINLTTEDGQNIMTEGT
jgi:hypothetical protein